MGQDFYSEVSRAYEKGINNPRFAKAIQYYGKDRDDREGILAKEIDAEDRGEK